MPLGVILGPWWPLGSPKSDFGHILVSFWEPSGSTFGVILAQKFEIGGIMSTFWCHFPVSEKERKRSSPGGAHAIRSRRRMFREGRPSSRRLHFGLHFGVALGAKLATILLLSRPGGI